MPTLEEAKNFWTVSFNTKTKYNIMEKKTKTIVRPSKLILPTQPKPRRIPLDDENLPDDVLTLVREGAALDIYYHEETLNRPACYSVLTNKNIHINGDDFHEYVFFSCMN